MTVKAQILPMEEFLQDNHLTFFPSRTSLTENYKTLLFACWYWGCTLSNDTTEPEAPEYPELYERIH